MMGHSGEWSEPTQEELDTWSDYYSAKNRLILHIMNLTGGTYAQAAIIWELNVVTGLLQKVVEAADGHRRRRRDEDDDWGPGATR